MRFLFITVRSLFVMMPVVLAFGQLKAADWLSVADLRGSWSFTVGDDPAWADPKLDATDWDWLKVPGRWESSYPDYNGYAWYRKSFNLRELPENANIVLFLGYIDDVDEVFINGRRIGQTGKFFPHFETAYTVERRYVVPASLLKRTGNVIAVRVFDAAMDGGIVRAGNFGLYYDQEQNMLSIDLSGAWKFSTDIFGDMHSPGLNDASWKELFVPMTWESQGYHDYDGVAWYRKRFTMPESFKGRELYLVIGKIDDLDQVYLNGTLIGRTEDLQQYSRFRRDEAYSLMRIYKIPVNLLRSKNILSVEVTDHHGLGGIYEGPVGIVTRETALKISDKHRAGSVGEWSFSFWDLLNLFD